jgi:UPF0755 protein
MKNQRLITIAAVILTISCFLGGWLYSLYSPVVSQDGGYTYYLRPGASKRLVINELAAQGVIRHPFLFSLYVFPQKDAQLKTGEYLFPKGATPVSIWKQITNGTGFIHHPFTIIPGWTFSQVRNELARAPGLRHMTATMDDKQIMAFMGHKDLSPEGEFYPETYYYTRGNPDLVILKRAFTLMQNRLQDAWGKRAQGLPYKTEYEALIAASLIEKEGYLNTERPLISGVLINRLNKNMLLQIDATVIYGLGSRYDGKIYKSNLLEDTPYNTYLHKGLPPTPIAAPGEASIEAALHPSQHDFYYYVAKGDGSHEFTRSLREHNAAVQAAKLRTGYFNEGVIRRHLEVIMGRKFKMITFNGGF